MIEGRAKVLDVEETYWDFRFDEQIWARANRVISLEVLAPPAFAGNKLYLGVVDKDELNLSGHWLQEGDIVDFEALEAVYTESLLPPVFSNLKDVRLVEKTCE